jgi:hypothetical protein
MQTVFSHIVRRRMSSDYENVATDALAFILDRSASARQGFLKLLRRIVPDLPELTFRAQEGDGGWRPDLWGFAGEEPRVLVENKFWAGLTDNQPVSYLGLLGAKEASLLLFVVPNQRLETVWRELERRLAAASLASELAPETAGVRVRRIQNGPQLAITSWGHLLDTIGSELADQPQTFADLMQLRSLCDAADLEAFLPISAEQLTDQQIPHLVLQLGSIVREVAARAETNRLIDRTGLRLTSPHRVVRLEC